MFHVKKNAHNEYANIVVYYNDQIVCEVLADQVTQELVNIEVKDGFGNIAHSWSDIIEDAA